MSDTKLTGCCTDCDDPVFEVNTMNPDGTPRSVGAALPNAMRATLVLTDGSTCDMTFCEGCMEAIEAHLPAIWAKCLRSFAAEPVDPEIRDEIRADQVRLATMVPLGVVAVRRWCDILKEERPLKWQV